MEKIRIDCKNGLYLENFIDESLKSTIKYKALFDIDPDKFFGIYDTKKQLIGEICNSVFFGLVIHFYEEENCGKGYGTKVLNAFCDFFFMYHKKEKVSAIIDNINIRSVRLYEKIGFIIKKSEDDSIRKEYILTKERFYRIVPVLKMQPKNNLNLIDKTESQGLKSSTNTA